MGAATVEGAGAEFDVAANNLAIHASSCLNHKTLEYNSGYCTLSTVGTQSPANYFDSPLASRRDNFEKMEVNFLQVILSFQNEFIYKTPR